MPDFTNLMHVAFVLEHCTLTTSVSDPDIDEWGYVVDQANALIGDEYGFYPKEFAEQIIVTNKYGDLIRDETGQDKPGQDVDAAGSPAITPLRVQLSLTYRFDPDDYLDKCDERGEPPTQEGFHAYVMDDLADNPDDFLHSTTDLYTVTVAPDSRKVEN